MVYGQRATLFRYLQEARRIDQIEQDLNAREKRFLSEGNCGATLKAEWDQLERDKAALAIMRNFVK